MTRERAKELLPLIQAYAEGKIVQAKLVNVERDTWDDQATPYFESDNLAYRVKPEPREFYIAVNSDGRFCGAYASLSHAKVSHSPPTTLIHVREVLP